jgi:ADP-L-glycero-D-manno-heptose 6-epimerase
MLTKDEGDFMYLLTGGAGFIGSNIAAKLSGSGKEVVVCDWLRDDQRWRNLAKHEISAIIAPPRLREWLQARKDPLAAVIHMGAISATTETDVDLIADNNIRATLDLLDWCTETQTPLIYASSAATYGDGAAGFDDDISPAALAKLRPLNAYGWSKHLVDRRVARLLERGQPLPPQIVGLKFFNVYGPNEYHKGSMQSVIAQNTRKVIAGEPLRLFRSYRPDYADGGQLRDFVYVDDCVEIVDWLLAHPNVSGLFNVGTGKARSWLDLAHAIYAAIEKAPKVEFIPMPSQLIDKYQYYTEAKMDRLKSAGYTRPLTDLESGVREYVRSYLCREDPYR